MMTRLLVILSASAALAGCGNEPSPSSLANPVQPSSASMASAQERTASPAARTGRTDIIVHMHDNCDPDSFDAVLGEGSCTRRGGMKFDQFISLLTKLGSVGPWHFAPNEVNARVGQVFHAVNNGGETHTFTEVEDFGGGIVPSLNALAHVPTVAPECQALDPDDFVVPGATYEEEIEHEGHEKYQCCIHPWMRLEASISH